MSKNNKKRKKVQINVDDYISGALGYEKDPNTRKELERVAKEAADQAILKEAKKQAAERAREREEERIFFEQQRAEARAEAQFKKSKEREEYAEHSEEFTKSFFKGLKNAIAKAIKWILAILFTFYIMTTLWGSLIGVSINISTQALTGYGMDTLDASFICTSLVAGGTCGLLVLSPMLCKKIAYFFSFIWQKISYYLHNFNDKRLSRKMYKQEKKEQKRKEI